jgi:hypothetical protein
MAYDGTKLSRLGGLMDGSFNLWLYRSADPIATVNTAGYISDATARGMKVRDLVWVSDTNVPSFNQCLVIAITAGAADLADGTVIAETNGD